MRFKLKAIHFDIKNQSQLFLGFGFDAHHLNDEGNAIEKSHSHLRLENKLRPNPDDAGHAGSLTSVELAKGR